VISITLDARGVIELQREVRSTDASLPDIPFLNPAFHPYDHLGQLKEVQVGVHPDLRSAALAALEHADSLGLVPVGFLLSPELCEFPKELRRKFGVPLFAEPRCPVDRVTLCCGLDPSEGLPAATAALVATFPQDGRGDPL